MPKVVFIAHDGGVREVEAPLGKSLMQAALDHAVAGILGDCGGACSCATCHAHVDLAWVDQLPPRSETEVFMLGALPGCSETSRLCCQLKMTPMLDGIVLHLPEDQV